LRNSLQAEGYFRLALETSRDFGMHLEYVRA